MSGATGETGCASDPDDGLGDGNLRIVLARGCRVPSTVAGFAP